jgi:hypothetical protein
MKIYSSGMTVSDLHAATEPGVIVGRAESLGGGLFDRVRLRTYVNVEDDLSFTNASEDQLHRWLARLFYLNADLRATLPGVAYNGADEFETLSGYKVSWNP